MEKRTLENVTEKISKIVKEKGVNGYYVYLENGVKLTDGTIVNEVRVNSEDKVECLEKARTRYCATFQRKIKRNCCWH